MKKLFRTALLYVFHIGFARPLLRFVVGVRYRRRSLVPEGPCLVVSNHNSHLDAAVLMGLFPLRRLPKVHPVAAADYFGSTLFKQALAMWMMNGIPIQRRPKPGTDPLQPVIDQLTDGHSLIFFPEGSRGEAGVVTRFRPGIGKLVQQIPGLLVLPVYLAGPERIWPRGQAVPIPLNIDAIVGKPRSYRADLGPREIAEQVQQDVLSLAPPPTPPPGEGNRVPISVAVCGLDADYRATVMRAVTERLGRQGPTFGLGTTILEAGPTGVVDAKTPIAHVPHRAWTTVLSGILGAGRRFTGRKFSEMIETARIEESVGDRRAAHFVVTDGSALVDLSAWAVTDFYRGVFDDGEMNRVVQYLCGQQKIPFGKWWSFLRRAPEVWLISELSLVRPTIPEVIVLASPPVAEVMQGLRASGVPLQPYQTEAMLERLLQGYRRMTELLRRRHRVRVIEVDPAQTDPREIAAEVERELQQLPEAAS